MTIRIEAGLSSPYCEHARIAYRCSDCKVQRLEAENSRLRAELDRLRVLVGDTSEWPTPVQSIEIHQGQQS